MFNKIEIIAAHLGRLAGVFVKYYDQWNGRNRG